MTSHLIPNPGPHIATPLTQRFLDELDRIAKHYAEIAPTVVSIREGDNDSLHALVRRSQAGDREAGVAAIGALLPRLSKVVLSRTPPTRWRATIDEYVTLAFLTIADVNPTEPADYLADKIIARARLRHDRQLATKEDLPIEFADRVPDNACQVDEIALARLEVREVARAVDSGNIRAEDLTEVAFAVLGDKPGRARSDAERQHLARARRRLALNYSLLRAA